MISAHKIRTNRENAQASTGPKTANGRARSARNALRHALSLPVYSNPALSEEVEMLACEIAGAAANAEIQGPARRVAEAQIDLRRVRYARHQLLSGESLTATPEGPVKLATILSEETMKQLRPWTGTNGGRCRGANLPFEPSTKQNGGVSMIV